MAEENTADDAAPVVVAAAKPDPKSATADRIVGHLVDALRNGPVSRDTSLWNHFQETILPAFKADIMKEL